MIKKIYKYPIRKNSKSDHNYINFLEKSNFINMDCYFCKSSKLNIIFSNDRYGITCFTSICNSCYSLQSNPKLSESAIDQFYKSNIYWENYVLDNYTDKFKIIYPLEPQKKISYKEYTETLFFEFINHLELNYQTVLEIGCAGGWNLIPFKKIGKKCFGVEPSSYFSKHKIDNIKIFNTNLENINEKFDMVILKHVLEHISDPIEFLKMAAERSNKYIYIEIPGVKNKMPSIQLAHLFYFNEEELKYIFDKCGLKIIKLKTIKSNNFILAMLEKSKVKEIKYFNSKKIWFKIFYFLVSFKYLLKSFLKNK